MCRQVVAELEQGWRVRRGEGSHWDRIWLAGSAVWGVFGISQAGTCLGGMEKVALS